MYPSEDTKVHARKALLKAQAFTRLHSTSASTIRELQFMVTSRRMRDFVGFRSGCTGLRNSATSTIMSLLLVISGIQVTEQSSPKVGEAVYELV